MLDMGGVLTQKHRLEKVDEMMSLLGLDCSREAFLETYFRLRNEYDRGAIDGASYWEAVGRSFGVGLDASTIRSLVLVDLQSWFNMRPSMLDFLGGVQSRIKRLVLLSNIHFDGAEYIRTGPGTSWASRFDLLILSCDHLLIKPDAAIYELALEKAGVQASEALFVDDNIENVEGALQVGMNSFQFLGEQEFLSTLERDYFLVGK
jgi:haloacid dehalogenase superfamily, subfamily IA, variant 3 with third motif having DD or ED